MCLIQSRGGKKKKKKQNLLKRGGEKNWQIINLVPQGEMIKNVFRAKNYMYVCRHKGVWGAGLPSKE